MNTAVATTHTANSIRSAIEANLPGAEVLVYSIGGDAMADVVHEVMVEVVHPSFSESDRTADQKKILNILNSHAKGVSPHIHELLTYKTGDARFNGLAHLHTVGSGQRNGIFTSTMAANDAYVFLAELDAAYLAFAWLQGGDSPFMCRAIAANKGVYASFPIREGVAYKELEIQGQHYHIKGDVKKEAGMEQWLIQVNIGFSW